MRRSRVRLSVAESSSIGDEGRDGEPCMCGSGWNVDRYCRRCRVLLCLSCVSGKHNHHDSQTIAVVAGEIRTTLMANISPECKKEKFDVIEDTERTIREMKTEVDTIERDQITRINEHIDTLHAELDKIRGKLLKRVTDVTKDDVEIINKAEMNIQRVAKHLTTMYETAESILNEENDVILIPQGYPLCEEMSDYPNSELTTPIRGAAFKTAFIPCNIDLEILDYMCGKVF